MHVWATFFVIFLGMIELYQWLQGFTLPLPALVVAGALLAIASNRNSLAGLPWQNPSLQPLPKPAQPKASSPTLNPSSPTPNSQSPSARPSPQLPNLTPPEASSQRSISFTIRKPQQNSQNS